MLRPLGFFLVFVHLIAMTAYSDEPQSGTPETNNATIDAASGAKRTSDDPTHYGRPAKLPRPSDLSVNEFERHLFEFVNQRKYVDLGWNVDKSVRDTGPYLNGKYYGTHPAVRIFYSPEITQWLVSGKQTAIPDGAVIIKEQFPPPAARYEDFADEQLLESLESWTIMVKDSQGSHDGWFWSNPGKGQQVVDYYKYPFEEPYSGFGLYCVRCHGSTKSHGVTNEYTFASLRNIQGFPGEPLLFRVDDSWRSYLPKNSSPEEEGLPDHSNEHLLAEAAARTSIEFPEHGLAEQVPVAAGRNSHPRCAATDYPTQCIPELNTKFLEFFPYPKRCDRADILALPPVTYDSVPRRPAASNESDLKEQAFITSNQCMSCHAGLTEPFGPAMFIPTGESAGYGEPGIHISPYGEWRWTPMGLAGRDPVFYAQLESERALLERMYDADKAKLIGENLQKTCLSCHGVMGKRQHDIDFGQHSAESFAVSDVYRAELNPQAEDYPHSKYGALARDGISCVVCHRMQPKPQPENDTGTYLEHFLRTSITGNFELGKPGELYGPYKDDVLAPYVMEHSIGFKPKHSDFIKQSQMCGTCHTVNLPIVNWELEDDEEPDELIAAEPNPVLKKFRHHVEQATYLEWLNSEFENEINTKNPQGRSCQDCHMSRGLVDPASNTNIPQIQTRVAVIQDQSYPDAENLATHQEINVRHRQEYSRHNFRGLNMFMLEMFNQFDDVLGVRKHDYMTGSKTDIPHAMNDFIRQATNETATIDIQARWNSAGELLADVDIHNLVGHRFPSGVGFRRAFIELQVNDLSRPADDQIVWSSGRTNEVGILVDHNGTPLPTEFFELDSSGQQQYQPHHTEITSSSQVQIYETLMHTLSGKCTTSFIHGCTIKKDNRLLPRGWTSEGPGGGLKGEFLSATFPGPDTALDPRYQDGSGSDLTRYRIRLPSGVERQNVEVRATIYYQAIPPYFLKNIFELSPDGPASQRLHYICSNLKLEGTPIEDWKLKVVSAVTKPGAEPDH